MALIISGGGGGGSGGGTTTIDTTVLAKEAKQDTHTSELDSIRLSTASADTKIGAAVTGDNQAAASIGSLFARLIGWDGANFQRLRAGVSALSSVLTGVLNTLPVAIYHLAPVTRTDGQNGPLETDAAGSLRVAVASSVTTPLSSIDGKLTAQAGPRRNTNLFSINVASTSGGLPTVKALSSTDVGTAIAAGAEFVFTAEGADIWWYADSAASGGTIAATTETLTVSSTQPDYIPSGSSTAPMTLAAACATGSIVAIGSNTSGILRIRKVN